MRVLSLLLLSLILLPLPVSAKRVALVIGNDSYVNVSPLQKAVNDARAVALVLRDIGFDVLASENLNRQSMARQLTELSGRISAGGEVVFYYAGHGISFKGQNFLLPVDIPKIKPGQQRFVLKDSFSEDEILDILREKGARVSILIIDACRNNPFPKTGTRSVGRSVGLGQRKSPPRNTFVIYSAGIGEEALDRLSDDDADPNSVFTRKLLPLLKTPGLSHVKMAKRLQVEVESLALTTADRHQQFPAFYDQVRGDYFFIPGAASPTKKPQKQVAAIKQKPVGQSPSAAVVLWKTISQSNKISDFEFYLKEFPSGAHRAVAKLKIRQLNLRKVAALKPAKPIRPEPPKAGGVSVAAHLEYLDAIYQRLGIFKMGAVRSELPSCRGCVPFVFYCTKRITRGADLKGLKVRAHTKVKDFVNRNGGQGLLLPSSEVAVAYQRGLIHCAATGGGVPKYSLNGPLPKGVETLGLPKSKLSR
ncbi:MAG: hypothetical protein DHS20C08_07090 [Rhodomicrobium sp.]|nr:MAG: hypothetical protein DHS20C08_07090 [Rhodomicrobium sp.]